MIADFSGFLGFGKVCSYSACNFPVEDIILRKEIYILKDTNYDPAAL